MLKTLELISFFQKLRTAYRRNTFSKEFDRVVRRGGASAIAHGYVQLLADEIADGVIRDDMYMDAWAFRLEAQKPRHQPQRREGQRRGYANTRFCLLSRDLCRYCSEFVQQWHEARRYRATTIGKDDCTRPALKKPRADVLLELLNLAADSGLSQKELGCCPSKREVAGDNGECF